jgi:serine/threonine protein kinase
LIPSSSCHHRNAGTATSIISLTGVSALAEIGVSAFEGFKGSLELRGSCPNLHTIAKRAFEEAGKRFLTASNVQTHIELLDLSSLMEIGKSAFEGLQGDVIIEGKCRSLKRIGEEAFHYILPTLSRVALSDMHSLMAIDRMAFDRFKGELALSGKCPMFTGIGFRMLADAANPLNRINLECVSPNGLTYLQGTKTGDEEFLLATGFTLKTAVFDLYGGQQNMDPPPPGCIECWKYTYTGQDKCTSTTTTMPTTVPLTTTTAASTTTTTKPANCPADEPECGNGVCKDGPNTWFCSCNAGWSGITCQIKVNSGGTSNSKMKKKTSPGTVAAIALSITAIVSAIIVFLFRRRRQDAEHRAEVQQLTNGLVEQARGKVLTHFEHVFSGPNKDDRAIAVANVARWLAGSRLSSSHIEVKQQLGVGRFGTVHVVVVQRPRGSPVTAVAKACDGMPISGRDSRMNITTAARGGGDRVDSAVGGGVRDEEQLVMFCAETLLMGAMYHPNILPVVGAILNTLPMQMMTEHMRNGDLKSYLRACRPTSKTAKEKLNAAKLLDICSQIADACVYLEGMKVVHRGLMASNCLVGRNHTHIKLSGFGSLREVLRADEYVKTSSGKDTDLDIRWMATECFTDNTFSTKSDVWSFAVLMWEVLSFARKPYGTFHPHEIAAEVRAGRRLERPELCPVELHDWMERCWLAVPTNRPTFSVLQGTLRLLLLDDADEFRAKVAAATRLQLAPIDVIVQWSLPMRGWEPTVGGLTDCGRFQLIHYRTVAVTGGLDAPDGQIAAAVRLGISASAAEDIAALKVVFTVLQDLKHEHVVELLGCTMVTGFVMLFNVGSLTLSAALHRGDGEKVPDLLATPVSKVDAALQMALGIEYLHAEHLVHSRLSSASFYFTADGTNLRLLLGNVLHADDESTQLQRPALRRYPANLRWTPSERLTLPGQPLSAPTAATDVYAFGVLLWELFAGAGLPHSSAFPTDDALFDAMMATSGSTPVLTAPSWGVDLTQAGMLGDIFTACAHDDEKVRPWISGVASIFLSEGPDRWEKDRTQLQFVQHLGSGQFGDVSKMSTRLFSPDKSLDFVAVKILKPASAVAGSGDPNSYSGYAMAAIVPQSGDAEIIAPPDPELLVEFLAEMAIMKQFRHPNLVQLLGCCTEVQPNYMILEFSTGGSLDEWLPVNGPKLLKPTAAKLVHLLHQVSLGMLALGQAEIIHRDLAARNVLVDERLQIKVADFGLSRDVEEDHNYYRLKTDRPLPLRWTAPESIKLGKFSIASDVYAFGVLVFEVFSFGALPFAAYPDNMVFVGFLAGLNQRPTVSGVGGGAAVGMVAVGPVHEPLVTQLGKVLNVHGVRAVPPLIEELLRCCVVRDPVRRLAFGQIARKTSRAGAGAGTVAAGFGDQSDGARGATVAGVVPISFAATAAADVSNGGAVDGARAGEAETKV